MVQEKDKKRVPQHHKMKILPEYFCKVCAGQKNFEIRRDDRDIQVGDTVVLLEWHPETGFAGAMTRPLHISYVLRNVPYHGLQEDYCIFSWDN